MFAIQLSAAAFLLAGAFTFASYILIDNCLIEWNDEYRRLAKHRQSCGTHDGATINYAPVP